MILVIFMKAVAELGMIPYTHLTIVNKVFRYTAHGCFIDHDLGLLKTINLLLQMHRWI